MINVLADQYLFNLQDYIPEGINLIRFDPGKGLPRELTGIHALLIRTVNEINKETLSEIPPALEFVGTASAGSDHVDIAYLNKNDITFSNAAGCNARSVAEYVGTALLLWSEENKEDLSDLTVGIIGVGNVGTQVVHLFNKLDLSHLTYDPPLELRDPDFESSSIKEILECDILTFHTPLTQKGQFPTYHWLDDEKLSNHKFKLILNTARGGVIDEKALREAKAKGNIDSIIIDTWENEPHLNVATAEQAFIKTPHIAGYSEQAKNNATEIVVNAMLNHFELQQAGNPEKQDQRIVKKDIAAFDSLSSLLTELHPIRKYEAELEKILQQNPDSRGKLFNKLRAEYPFRQEFAQTLLPASYFDRFPILGELGFSLLGSDSK